MPQLGDYDPSPKDLQNVYAVLAMIRACEGTAGPDGYRTRFGGSLFDSYADHPGGYVPFRNQRGELQYSSAAGAYQFLKKTWDVLKVRLGLPDFSPTSQDLAAIELIREQGALDDAMAGRLQAAIDKISDIWASLPASTYPQPKKSFAFASQAFASAGGTFA